MAASIFTYPSQEQHLLPQAMQPGFFPALLHVYDTALTKLHTFSSSLSFRLLQRCTDYNTKSEDNIQVVQQHLIYAFYYNYELNCEKFVCVLIPWLHEPKFQGNNILLLIWFKLLIHWKLTTNECQCMPEFALLLFNRYLCNISYSLLGSHYFCHIAMV